MSQQTVNEAVTPSLIRINHIVLWIYEDAAAGGLSSLRKRLGLKF